MTTVWPTICRISISVSSITQRPLQEQHSMQAQLVSAPGWTHSQETTSQQHYNNRGHFLLSELESVCILWIGVNNQFIHHLAFTVYMHLYTPCNYQGTPPVPISSFHSYSHSLRGNHLPAKSQLVGHTVSSEALATDAINVVAKCDLHVSTGR